MGCAEFQADDCSQPADPALLSGGIGYTHDRLAHSENGWMAGFSCAWPGHSSGRTESVDGIVELSARVLGDICRHASRGWIDLANIFWIYDRIFSDSQRTASLKRMDELDESLYRVS